MATANPRLDLYRPLGQHRQVRSSGGPSGLVNGVMAGRLHTISVLHLLLNVKLKHRF
jgi:hypothetical protein